MLQPPQQTTQHTNPPVTPATSGSDQPDLHDLEDVQASSPGIPIEELGEPTPEAATPQSPAVEPFTDEEILSAVGVGLMLGLRLQDEEEVRIWNEHWNWIVKPMLPTAAVLKPLRLGDALAKYGIGKGMLPGTGALENLPDWVRLLIGGAVLSFSAFGGFRAVQEYRAQRAQRAQQSA